MHYKSFDGSIPPPADISTTGWGCGSCSDDSSNWSALDGFTPTSASTIDPSGTDPANPSGGAGGRCSTGFSGGLSYGGSADFGNAVLGITSTASEGGGVFHNSNTGWSLGGFAGGGIAVNAGPVVTGKPAQNGQSLAVGAYAGAGPNVWISNAGAPEQLSGPFNTLTLNIGAGTVKFSAQLSYGNGIWQMSVGPPVPYVSGATPSGSISKVTTKTVTTHSGC